jgi:pimeloyl-ACP methyl ester carboxylesterase
MLLRPLWPASNPQEINDWFPFSADLLRLFSEQRLPSLIGVGHSIGAIVTLRAALQEPGRFRALVLIDPVLFPRYYMLEWNILRIAGLGQRLHPLINATQKRRRVFDDLEKMYSGYRRRPVFRFFSDANLHVLTEGMTRRMSDGRYELLYSPEWEARIYYTGVWHDWDLWDGIAHLEIPTLILRGAETDTFWESTARKVGRSNPRIKIISLKNSTHLLPLERPQEVFEITSEFLQNLHPAA